MNISVDTYLVTQKSHSRDRSTPEIVSEAIEGGIDVVQLREKHETIRSRYTIGKEIRALTEEAGIPFIINDRVDLAAALNADGVHLGDDDLPVKAARDVLGNSAIIGRSVSTVSAATEAVDAGADYLGVGAVYQTSSKDVDDAEAEIGKSKLTEIAESVEVPIVAIGGITPDRAHSVIEAGADGVAVISAITKADDPRAATVQLNKAVVSSSTSPEEVHS
jgi:thiamine-phosphate pyrophosphorylase